MSVAGLPSSGAVSWRAVQLALLAGQGVKTRGDVGEERGRTAHLSA